MNKTTGSANLPIGPNDGRENPKASQEIGEPKVNQANQANQEIGEPTGEPSSEPRGEPYWHSRGYLPHFESPDAIQHVTFHLGDSLPKAALARIEAEVKRLPPGKQKVERRKRLEVWLDAGHGSCVLREPEIGQMVQNSLLFFDNDRYRLLEWVVMPNHVHVLFQPLEGWTVAKIVASWKKFTARKICDYRKANREIGEPRFADLPIGKPERVWQREYWDRYIRNERHLQQVILYIHHNPVKAGLVATAEEWRWGSAFLEAKFANQAKANQEIGEPGSAKPGSAKPGSVKPGSVKPGSVKPGSANLPIGPSGEA